MKTKHPDFGNYSNIFTEVLEYKIEFWEEPENFLNRKLDEHLSIISGIYFFKVKSMNEFNKEFNLDLSNEIFYVGRSKNIKRRMQDHFKNSKPNSSPIVKKIIDNLYPGYKKESYQKLTEDVKYLRLFSEIQSMYKKMVLFSVYEEKDPAKQAIKEILFSLKYKTELNSWMTH